jgi:hypothetical protein
MLCNLSSLYILWNSEIVNSAFILIRSLTSRHGASSGCEWRKWPPDTKGNCEGAQDEAADGGKSELIVGAEMDDNDQLP